MTERQGRDVAFTVPRLLLERLARAGAPAAAATLDKLVSGEAAGRKPVAFFGPGGILVLDDAAHPEMDHADISYDPDTGSVTAVHVAWSGPLRLDEPVAA